jgi:hypothetical protein
MANRNDEEILNNNFNLFSRPETETLCLIEHLTFVVRCLVLISSLGSLKNVIIVWCTPHHFLIDVHEHIVIALLISVVTEVFKWIMKSVDGHFYDYPYDPKNSLFNDNIQNLTDLIIFIITCLGLGTWSFGATKEVIDNAMFEIFIGIQACSYVPLFLTLISILYKWNLLI